MFIRLLPLLLAILVAGCDQSKNQHEQEGMQRQLIQGMHGIRTKCHCGTRYRLVCTDATVPTPSKS